jgi:CubicO group peptidase (beta-lactamase class C family)
MRASIISSLMLSVLLVCNCSAPNAVNTTSQQLNTKGLEPSGVNSKNTQSIDSLLQSLVDQKKVSSVVGFIAKNGTVEYHKAFGWKDIENKVPASPDDYYILFSQTKAITTVAFMTLVEKGLVDIHDPVSKYFPGIPNRVVTAVHEDGTYETRPVSTPMTFVHLMSHTSGLGSGLVREIRRVESQPSGKSNSIENTSTDKVPNGQHSFGGIPNAKYLEEEMLALSRYPLGSDPGSEWNYHISTNMLGYMIERISGKPLREYVKTTVLEPLGMKQTDWYYKPEDIERFVKAYDLVDGELKPTSNAFSKATTSSEQTYCEGAIGLNGPISDYARFCQMLLNKGEFNGKRILKSQTVELMTTVNRLPKENSGGKGFQFGLGFELYNEVKKPVGEVSNSAYAWGGLFGTEYVIDPENNMIVLFYLNMPKREHVYPMFLSKAYQTLGEK